MITYRITCRVADAYFAICKQDNETPTYEGLKEFARACHV